MRIESAKSHQGVLPAKPASIRDIAALFFKLGAIAFGGPAAHIAMMEEEVVRRRGWLSRGEFLDLLGATNLIPGPNSTELAIHIGHRQAGWRGLLIAGICFILPSSLIVGGFAWAYVRYGSLPQAGALLYGVKPVIIAIVLQALWRLGGTALKTKWLALVGALGVVLSLLGAHELLVLFGAGVAGTLISKITGKAGREQSAPPSPESGDPKERKRGGWFLPLPLMYSIPAAAPAVGLWPLFLFFLKVGSVLFGSGYVLLAFIRADLVERWHWLTEAQLLDAIAVGQLTPGPVVTAATFIGYLLAGPPGAVVATFGIFLPAFAFVAASGPLVPRIRRSRIAGAFLDGVNAASLSLMVVVTGQLVRSAIVDVTTGVLAVLSLLLLVFLRLKSMWLVLGGAATGLVIQGFLRQ